jgi:hypothetical protein
MLPSIRALLLSGSFFSTCVAGPLPVQRFAAFQFASCITNIQPANIGLAPGGGAFALSLTAPPTCAWSITSNVPWLGTDQPNGVGPAVVRLNAAPNPGSTRVGFLIVSGQGIPVTQAGPGGSACSFELAPSNLLAPPVGQAAVLVITAGQPSCPWTALSRASWIQVFPLSGSGSAAVEYTIYPNFSTKARDGVVNIGGQLFSVSQLGATATLNERFVSMMYYNFFGRLPSNTELVQQVTALVRGLSRTSLVMSFFNSPEFNLGGRFIAGLYVGVLNRDAEFSGWLFQRNAIAKGGANPRGLVMNFVNSIEFGLRFGSPTADEFVRIMYRNILLREPSPAEVAFQVAALDRGVTRVQLTENFLNSSEFRTGTGARLTAFLLYAVLLGRDPSPGDLTFRAMQLQSGTSVQTLVGQFLNAPEFLAQIE